MSRIPKFFRSFDWKYSLREIFLIVIGILIALSINNWNEQRKLYHLETEMLKELRASLKNDMKDILINLDIHKKSFQSAKLLISHIKANSPYHDTLDAHFGKVLGSSFFLSDNVAYNSLESKGRQLVTNDSIRSMLSTLYAHDYGFIKELEIIDNENLLINIKPYYTRNFKEFRLFITATPINYTFILTDPTYIGELEWIRDNRFHSVTT